MAGNEPQAILNTLSAATPWDVFLAAMLVTKLCMLISVVALVAAVALAIARRASGGKRSGALNTVGIIGLSAGIAGAAYTGFNGWIASQYLPAGHFTIFLPAIVESGYAVLYGLLVWLVVAVGNGGARAA